MICSKLEAKAIYVLTQTSVNDIWASVYMHWVSLLPSWFYTFPLFLYVKSNWSRFLGFMSVLHTYEEFCAFIIGLGVYHLTHLMPRRNLQQHGQYQYKAFCYLCHWTRELTYSSEEIIPLCCKRSILLGLTFVEIKKIFT